MKHQNYHNAYMAGKSIINTSAQPLEISYHYSGKHILNSSWWHETNVICPLTKMFYILEGEILIKIDKTEILATAGDMMIIPAGVKHDYCLTESNYAHKFWVHFDLKINHTNLFDHYDFPYKIPIGANPLIFSLFTQLIDMKAEETTWQNLTKASILCRLVDFYIKQCPIKLKNKNDFIWMVVEYINNNYMEKINLSELARRAHLSTNQFLRRFKTVMGTTPIQYINFLRLDHAKHLIEQTDKPISLIMEETGFYDSAHFSKSFKAYFNYSPSRYRELYKKS